jgi:hypothetical protein
MKTLPKRRSIGQTSRTLQTLIVGMWEKSGMSKNEVMRQCPTVCTSSLIKYLNGDRKMYLRERTMEAIIAAVSKGKK